jgi:hypothetical protein
MTTNPSTPCVRMGCRKTLSEHPHPNCCGFISMMDSYRITVPYWQREDWDKLHREAP